jgi:hypothetical protein
LTVLEWSLKNRNALFTVSLGDVSAPIETGHTTRFATERLSFSTPYSS